jgi:uncharacterized protein YndB with AHSA1/START domain
MRTTPPPPDSSAPADPPDNDPEAATSSTLEIEASPERLYEMVSDVTRMGEWSPETRRCEWLGDATGPAVGARFKGVNQIGNRKWGIVSVVTQADPGRVFAFDATAGPIRYATWTYTFEPTDTGTLVTESCADHRGFLLNFLGGLISGVKDRSMHNRQNIADSLTALKRVAEAP